MTTKALKYSANPTYLRVKPVSLKQGFANNKKFQREKNGSTKAKQRVFLIKNNDGSSNRNDQKSRHEALVRQELWAMPVASIPATKKVTGKPVLKRDLSIGDEKAIQFLKEFWA